MFSNIFKRRNTEPQFTITETSDGRFAIVDRTANQPVSFYTRKRDAVRGAKRRGLTLA